MEVLSVSNVNYNKNEDFEYNYPESEEMALIEALTVRLEQELKTAKKEHLTVGEVLLPSGLTRRISQEMFLMGDSEPCGLRGCTLYINFEGEEVKRISKIKCDPTTPTTFELYLTLKQSTAGWNAFLPQFLKKITRGGGTVMVSPEYGLQKKKLYRSSE